MHHYHHDTLLTDQLERRLIQEELGRQMAFAPNFNLQRLADRIAAFFGYVRIEGPLNHARGAH